MDADIPALTGLEPDPYDALRAAEVDTAADGVEIGSPAGGAVAPTSNASSTGLWRGTAAGRRSSAGWPPPRDSAHVTGDAVDIGPTDAAYWMSRYGAAHGLCQTFAHEIWHYELRGTSDGTCPPASS
ncbi:hypothetical protein [Nocardioides alkalitolerans]|uniref:hypothetical protein n=1 Tax=Nocardioides alkalitolerans TaxID=281714 RepID=UPI000A04A791|nr:hypothetical protein [Nocardioides alkalitolerans]